MSDNLVLADLLTPEFHTSESAMKLNKAFEDRLGAYRYGPARLALAVSLSEKKIKNTDVRLGKGGIRGNQLFDGTSGVAMWTALIVQHAGKELSRREFNAHVAAHWERGIILLEQMWQQAEGDLGKFIAALSEKSGASADFVHGQPAMAAEDNTSRQNVRQSKINLHIGQFVGGEGQDAQWAINDPGRPPHIAIMGGTGTGKTQLALKLIEGIFAQGKCATFIFDMKGDIGENSALVEGLGSTVIKIPDAPVPLDVLHVADRSNNTAVQNVATSLSASVSLVTTKGGMGPKQMDTLREVAADAIASESKVSLERLRDRLSEHYDEKGTKPDSVFAVLNSLCAFNLFTPDSPPANFFGKNWVFSLNEAAEGNQRFAALMILDALKRYFVHLPDAEKNSDGSQKIRALLVIDEAHKILGFRHPAVNDILRLVRSKGGVVLLISQSPKDYMKEDTNFLENIGLTLCFNSTAIGAAIKNVFKENVAVSKLEKGVCYARFSGEHNRPKKVKIWG